VLGWISDQVNFWSGDGEARPGEQQVVADARAATRSIVGTGLRVADAYYTGGTAGSFARNVVAPNARIASPTTRNQGIRAGEQQFGRDVVSAAAGAAAGYGIGRGVVAGARRAFPNRVTEIGVHMGNPNNGSRITGNITYNPRRSDTGFGGIEGHPPLVGQTYKWSGSTVDPTARGMVGSELTSEQLANSSLSMMGWSKYGYITRSPVGNPDPELRLFDNPSTNPLYRPNQRIVPKQKIVETVELFKPPFGNVSDARRDIAAGVARQRAILAAEQARTAGRAGVFGAGLGTAGQTTFVGKNGRRRNVR